MKMKVDGRNRRKVVVRRLPPTQFFDQTDRLFSGRYNWACYRPGTISSRKYQRFSRAYIEFKGPEDLLHFAEVFDGHIFVNEKGVQYKATIEYAPSQSVSKPSFKDQRDGTIFKDERHVVTPLMEFVRKKRGADSGTQGLNASQKVGGRANRGKLHSIFVKNGPDSDKRKNILRDTSKSTNKKNLKNDNANSSLGEKKILFHKGKVPKVIEGENASVNSPTSISKQRQHSENHARLMHGIVLPNEARGSYGTVPHRKVELKIMQNTDRLHEPNSFKSRLPGHATTSHSEAKKTLYGYKRMAIKNRSDQEFKEPCL